jgi:hypothetical protein
MQAPVLTQMPAMAGVISSAAAPPTMVPVISMTQALTQMRAVAVISSAAVSRTIHPRRYCRQAVKCGSNHALASVATPPPFVRGG